MNIADAPRKPMIFADDPLENERTADLANRPERFDASYVPGYSEAVMENEQRARKGLTVKPIPRLQWARITGRTGVDVNASDEGMVEWRGLGYRAMGLDDLQRYGFGFPPTAVLVRDGTIRRGDLALFFVDENRAMRNRLRQKADREELAEARAAQPGPEPVAGLSLGETTRTDRRTSLDELSKLELPRLGD